MLRNPTLRTDRKGDKSGREAVLLTKAVRNIYIRITAVLAAAVMLLAALPVSAFAEGAGTNVVVGVYTDFGISMSGSSVTGISYEHLEQMSKFSNHRYTYVEGTPRQLMAMLAEGRIDVIPCVTPWELEVSQKRLDSEGKKNELTLVGDPIMTKYSAVYVRKGSDMAFMDTAALNKAKIGYLADNRNKYFTDDVFICSEFDGADFVQYSTELQMQADFESGKVDAVIKDCLRQWENESIVYQLATENAYFLVGDPDSPIAGELAAALRNIHATGPYFSTDMYVKYVYGYGMQCYALTNAEKEFVKKQQTLRIAYNVDSDAFAKEGSTVSVSAGNAYAFSRIENFTGLKITFVPCSGLAAGFRMLEDGSVDAIYGGVNTLSVAPYGSYHVSSPVSSAPIAFAGFSYVVSNKFVKVAVPSYTDDIASYIKELNPSAVLIPYSDEEACILAVEKGEADIMCASAFELLYTRSLMNSNIRVLEVLNANHIECMAMKESTVQLNNILGKALASVGYNDDIIRTADFLTMPVTGVAELSRYLPIIIIAAAVLMAGFIAILVVQRVKAVKRSRTDPVTGGRTKAGFVQDSRSALKKSSPKEWAVAVFDFDKFKYVNDRFGYDEGDRMLIRMHQTISDNAEVGEVFARLSDDNFAFLMNTPSDKDVTARLIAVFDEFSRRNALFVKYPTYFSAGVCRLGQYMDSNDSIDFIAAMDRAVLAKKTIKGASGNHIAFYDGRIRDRALREKDYESAMPQALKEGEFQCYLQPKFGLQSRHIEGAEALIRWDSKEFGFVMPGDFIPLSERNGFVVELDFYILEEVCKAIRRWLDDGKTPVVISVNQSRLHLNNDDYIWRLREIVDKYNVPYQYIELELTESVFTEDVDHLLKIMHKLHELGFKLSIDDFGSGYSSLNMLKDIPADVVKIDREFFNGTVNSEKGRAVIETVVDLAKRLNMEVISEGVETKDQVDFLTEIDCHMVQGYYFSKPMPMHAYEAMWYSDLESARAEAAADNASETPEASETPVVPETAQPESAAE